MINEAARGCLNEQAALFTHKDMTGTKEKNSAPDLIYAEGFDRAAHRRRVRDKHIEETVNSGEMRPDKGVGKTLAHEGKDSQTRESTSDMIGIRDEQSLPVKGAGQDKAAGKASWRKIKLRISGLTDDSIVDGPGMRYTVFTQGCPHHCPGCHNPQTWTYTGGRMESLGRIMDEIRENPLLYGVTFSGGEPFDQADEMAALGRQVKEAGLNLMAYSGYTYEELRERALGEPAVGELLTLVDILVDGKFEQDKKDLTLLYRGSTNQRLIDLEAMRRNGDPDQIIIWEELV